MKLKILSSIILVLMLTIVVCAEPVIIYDTITPSQYKTLLVTSDVCTTLHATCIHEWYLNGSYYGGFEDGESVQVPNGSSVNVKLYDPVNTNLEDLPETKFNYIIVVTAFAEYAPLFGLIILIYLIWKHETDKKKRRRFK